MFLKPCVKMEWQVMSHGGQLGIDLAGDKNLRRRQLLQTMHAQITSQMVFIVCGAPKARMPGGEILK